MFKMMKWMAIVAVIAGGGIAFFGLGHHGHNKPKMVVKSKPLGEQIKEAAASTPINSQKLLTLVGAAFEKGVKVNDAYLARLKDAVIESGKPDELAAFAGVELRDANTKRAFGMLKAAISSNKIENGDLLVRIAEKANATPAWAGLIAPIEGNLIADVNMEGSSTKAGDLVRLAAIDHNIDMLAAEKAVIHAVTSYAVGSSGQDLLDMAKVKGAVIAPIEVAVIESGNAQDMVEFAKVAGADLARLEKAILATGNEQARYAFEQIAGVDARAVERDYQVAADKKAWSRVSDLDRLSSGLAEAKAKGDKILVEAVSSRIEDVMKDDAAKGKIVYVREAHFTDPALLAIQRNILESSGDLSWLDERAVSLEKKNDVGAGLALAKLEGAARMALEKDKSFLKDVYLQSKTLRKICRQVSRDCGAAMAPFYKYTAKIAKLKKSGRLMPYQMVDVYVNKARLLYTVAANAHGVGVGKLEKMWLAFDLKTPDLNNNHLNDWIAFAKLEGADVRPLEALVLKTNDFFYIKAFANSVPGLSMGVFEDAVVKADPSGKLAAAFAREVNGANAFAIGRKILDTKNTVAITNYFIEIDDARSMVAKAPILAGGNGLYYASLITFGAGPEKVLDVVLKEPEATQVAFYMDGGKDSAIGDELEKKLVADQKPAFAAAKTPKDVERVAASFGMNGHSGYGAVSPELMEEAQMRVGDEAYLNECARDRFNHKQTQCQNRLDELARKRQAAIAAEAARY